MGSYKKYIGVIIFVVVLVASLVIAYQQIMPKIDESKTLEATIANKEREYKKVQDELKIIQEKLSKLK